MATSTKRTGKKPTKRPLAKPRTGPAKQTTVKAAVTARKPAEKPAKLPLAKPADGPAKDTIIEVASTTGRQAAEEAARPEHTWVVWQDGRGIWVGTQQDFKHSKRPETIVCDVIDRGAQQASAALHRAIQLGQTLRQTYASYMKYWLQYNDAAQEQRIQDWYERLGDR